MKQVLYQYQYGALTTGGYPGYELSLCPYSYTNYSYTNRWMMHGRMYVILCQVWDLAPTYNGRASPEPVLSRHYAIDELD
eukprot:scaffold87852_cov21-Prasinocladus_malaysianus.AAC.1